MLRGAKSAGGLTTAAVKKLLQQANSEDHRSASTEQINTALHSLTFWGEGNATLVVNGTKFKAISTAHAPPPRATSPSSTLTVTGQPAGASSQINSPIVDQNATSGNARSRSNDLPDALDIGAPLLEEPASEEPTASAATNTLSSESAKAESLLARTAAAEFVRKAQLSFHSQASSTLELFTTAQGMSVDPDETFLQKESTRHATNIIGKFMGALQTAVTTKIFSPEQLLMLPDATAAILEVLRNLVLAGLDPSTLTACPFCLATVASMTQGDVADLAPLVENKPYNLHLLVCTEFMHRASSLQLEVIRVGPYHHPIGARQGPTLQACIDALRTITTQVHGTDPVQWPRTLVNLDLSILTAVHLVTDAQRQHVRRFHHHWPADPTQEGIEALVSQISTETNTLGVLSGDDPSPSDTTGTTFAATTRDSSDAAGVESTLPDAPSGSKTRPTRSPARSRTPPRSPRARSRGSSLRSTSVARSRSLSRTPRGEGSKKFTTRRSTGPRPVAVSWETFGDTAPSPPQSKRPRHSAPRGSSSESHSPRNDPISTSSMGSITASTAKSLPAGGLPPKEAALEGVSNSSADAAAAAAVMTVMRDRDGTTSLEASIMTKVEAAYPDFSPSALRRATNSLISKGLITVSPSRGGLRDCHLQITSGPTKASSGSPAPTTSLAQHNTRASILDLVAKTTQSRPLGLSCAELWTLYHAAAPSTDQITYLLEFDRLVDQKIFVPPNDAPPGTERVIIQVGYNYRRDRMTTLPSDEGHTGTSSTPSRPTGASRIPRISDAPPPIVRYTVKPTEEQRATCSRLRVPLHPVTRCDRPLRTQHPTRRKREA
ncbi:hypothetical protein T484DRAFT_2350616 [Baffinella frigidus]|nr:hypothetical protein T484DRAFT_2350616 [Cryptophyta sp. CCMP2293]